MFGKKTKAYNKILEMGIRLRSIGNNLQIVNLGSTASLNDFDYSILNKRGCNLASAPQTLLYDYQLIKKYINSLSNDGSVCIAVCQFTFLVYEYSSYTADLKYYNFMERGEILNYSYVKHWFMKNLPFAVMPSIIKEVFNDLFMVKKQEDEVYVNSQQSDIQFSEKWVNGWKKEFGWGDEMLLTRQQKKNADVVFNVLGEMMKYCSDHGKQPVLIITPVSENIIKRLPDKILEDCFWCYIKSIEDMGYPVVNFWNDKELSEFGYFKDALCLNEKGKVVFNRKLKNILYGE